MNEIFTHFIKLPLQTKGLVIPTPEGDYIVIINSMFASETNKETYQHELRHIMLGHHEDTERPVTEIEKEASDTSLLVEEIITASLQGISSPLFPKNLKKENRPVKKEKPNALPIINLTMMKKEAGDSIEKMSPYLLPADSDPLDILEAVLKNLQETQRELDVYLQEKSNSSSKGKNSC